MTLHYKKLQLKCQQICNKFACKVSNDVIGAVCCSDLGFRWVHACVGGQGEACTIAHTLSQPSVSEKGIS